MTYLNLNKFIVVLMFLMHFSAFGNNSLCPQTLKIFLENRISRSQSISSLDWHSIGDGSDKVLSLIGAKEVNDYVWHILTLARRSIEIQSLKFQGDEWKKLLIRKVQEGVSVHLQVSAVDELFYPENRKKEFRQMLQELRDAGVVVDEFNPKVLARKSQVYSPDMHKKVVVVDGQLGYLGNKNINHYDDSFELGVGLRGNVVNDLRELIYRDFANSTKDESFLEEMTQIVRTSQVRLLNAYELKSTLFHKIDSAQSHILLAQNELADADVVEKLIEKKRSNPQVLIQLVTKKKIRPYQFGKVTIQRRLGFRQVDELKNAGIEILEYNPEITGLPHFHTKINIFDDKEVILGSSDLTERGLVGNAEIDIVLESSLIAQEFSKYVLKSTGGSRLRSPLTFSDRQISLILDMTMELLNRINDFARKVVSKIELSPKLFKILVKRMAGKITQLRLAFEKVYSPIYVKDLNFSLKPYQANIKEMDLKDHQLEEDEVYVFVGTTKFGVMKTKKFGMDQTLNGYYGNGYYFATNIETAIDYSNLRNEQTYNLPRPSEVLIFKAKKGHVISYLFEGLKATVEYDSLLVEAAEGRGRDYLVLKSKDDFQLVGHVTIKFNHFGL